MEQLEQKADKRQRTREYKIIHPYSGSWFPLWGQGFAVAYHPPCTDEPRISLSKDDIVKVTRWKRYLFFSNNRYLVFLQCLIPSTKPVPENQGCD